MLYIGADNFFKTILFYILNVYPTLQAASGLS